MQLDEVCERLWDVARLAHLDLNAAKNYSAKRWFEQQDQFTLPTDARGLRERQAAPGANVIRYSRRRQSGLALSTEESGAAEILFIDENSLPPVRRDDDDDILYIGD
jgi:hypothetical protein